MQKLRIVLLFWLSTTFWSCSLSIDNRIKIDNVIISYIPDLPSEIDHGKFWEICWFYEDDDFYHNEPVAFWYIKAKNDSKTYKYETSFIHFTPGCNEKNLYVSFHGKTTKQSEDFIDDLKWEDIENITVSVRQPWDGPEVYRKEFVCKPTGAI